MLAQTNTTLVKANAEQQATITKLTTKSPVSHQNSNKYQLAVAVAMIVVVVFDPKNYCWSHGYKLAHIHTSAACTNKKEGHKSEATRRNPMGGSTWNSGYGNAPNGA